MAKAGSWNYSHIGQVEGFPLPPPKCAHNTVRYREVAAKNRLAQPGHGRRDREVPKRGALTGPNPTDRAKCGSKGSLLVDGNGIPLAVEIAGANRHDCKLVEATLDNFAFSIAVLTAQCRPRMHMDKGYDSAEVRATLESWGIEPAILSRRDERDAKR